MANSIVELDPKLIGQILSYDDTSHLSLPLWLTGNSALQKLLSQGVYFVELWNRRKFDICYIPKYVTNLHSLRHLVIDRSSIGTYGDVYDHERSVSIIKELPKAMESIILRFRNSTPIFFKSSGSSKSNVDVRSTFPQLKRLHLDMTTPWSPSNFLEMPATVSDYHIALPPTHEKIMLLITSLPPHVDRLTCYSIDWSLDALPVALWTKLPVQLTYLHVMREHHYTPQLDTAHLTSLPPNLSAFHLAATRRFSRGLYTILGGSSPSNVEVAQAPNLLNWNSSNGGRIPQFVSKLSILTFADKKFGPSLSTLPSHLESLQVFVLAFVDPKIMRLLPRRLTSLDATFKDLSDFKEGDIPPTLRNLSTMTIKGDPFENSRFRKLLPPLLSVNLHRNWTTSTKSFNNLPQTLERIECLIDEADVELTFPPNLRALNLQWTTNITVGIPGEKDPAKLKKTKHRWGGVNKAPPMPFGAVILNGIQLNQLPTTVTSLILTRVSIPTSELIHLPPRLTHLHIDYISEDPSFRAADERYIARARYLLKLEGAGEENYDFRLRKVDVVPQVTLFDLLPRSLTTLHLCAVDPLPEEIFARLPKNLVDVTIVSKTPISGTALLYMKFPKLEYISLSLRGMDDLILRCLPPRLIGVRNHYTEATRFPQSSFGLIPRLEELQPSPSDGSFAFWDQWLIRLSRLDVAAAAQDVDQVITLRDNWTYEEPTAEERIQHRLGAFGGLM